MKQQLKGYVHATPRFVAIVLVGTRTIETTELRSDQLRVVVALLAAVVTGRIGATLRELTALTGMQRPLMADLQRKLWVVCLGKIHEERVWAPSKLAARRLGVTDWKVLLFSDEELPHVDPDAPGFLDVVTRTVKLEGPQVVDTTGEGVEEERAAS